MKKITFLFLAFTGLTFGQTAVPIFPTTEFSGSYFGQTLAIEGNNIAASTTYSEFLPSNAQGKVYVFDNNNGTVTQNATLYADGIANSDNFGRSLAFGGDYLAVSAPFHNNGSVYMYKKVAGSWMLTQVISGAVNDQIFAIEIKISGDYLFAASAANLKIYKLQNEQWTFHQQIDVECSKIVIDNNVAVLAREAGEEGYSTFRHLTLNAENWVLDGDNQNLASDGEYVKDFSFENNILYTISGSNFEPGGLGNGVVRTHIYNNQWSTETLFISNGNFDQLWTKISVSGDDLYIGSNGYGLQIERKFPLLHYKKTGDVWGNVSPLYGTGPAGEDDYFGSEVAVDGDHLVVGASVEGLLNYGKAYVFDMTLGTKRFDSNSFSVYPNPTRDILNVSNESRGEILKVAIYSLSGKLLVEENSSKISIGNLATGMYLAKVTAADGLSETIKVIKN